MMIIKYRIIGDIIDILYPTRSLMHDGPVKVDHE